MKGPEPVSKRKLLYKSICTSQKLNVYKDHNSRSNKKAQHAAAKKVIDNCETLDRPKYKPKRPKTINMGMILHWVDVFLTLSFFRCPYPNSKIEWTGDETR